MTTSDLTTRFCHAIQVFWDTRREQQRKQAITGRVDAGMRGAVTGGAQMAALELLVVEILRQVGLRELDIRTKRELELPGYYRPEKKWDLLVIAQGTLVCAIEFKSQVGPSFGNNFNNRVEEAIGSALDLWTAYREGLLGMHPRPFLGYFFLLEDCDKVHRPVRNEEPYFQVDPAFKNASYAKRYEAFCRRLLRERLYDAVCLTLATNELNTRVSHPAADLTFERFILELQASVMRFLAGH
ncbi:type-2 restriction enzyme [Thermogemmatispora aurantia]|uniref:Type-2 restriction enzyme n=1 Tax=Thermogemmatispora aurantia TaxID=2045279 RepID=A0A5J4K7D4_9CHLR|nr:PaeR7I family type II restriction endonuclease [Thermogemmatispora aurantia]GER82601.1 type-2 restriction enzyme [Thermogemmatispora aurantia]